MSQRILIPVLGLIILIAAAGCGSGGSGGIGQNAGLATAQCLVLNLDSGAIDPRQAMPTDLATNAAYRTNLMVFVAVPEGSITGGSVAGSRWALPDESPVTVGSSRVFAAVFETTRGQWRRMTGATPWTALPSELAGADDDTTPAAGVGLTTTQSGLATASARLPGAFSLPTASQWEYLCRGGSTGIFSWGSAVDLATAARYAVTVDTVPALTGPLPARSREANAFGLYDLHGNLWELTSDGQIRGGSWRDGLPMARAANRLESDPLTDHALVGTRLLYRPDVD